MSRKYPKTCDQSVRSNFQLPRSRARLQLILSMPFYEHAHDQFWALLWARPELTQDAAESVAHRNKALHTINLLAGLHESIARGRRKAAR